jgi:hypothetical protein
MKVNLSKKIILLISIVLLAFSVVGTSLAFIFMETLGIQNGFDSAKVSCAVVEKGIDPAENGKINVSIKEDVQIKNTGDTQAYIRVSIVITWKNADGTKVYAAKPLENADYKIEFSQNTEWDLGSDGYYYFASPVNASETTDVLITSVEQLRDGPIGSDASQYYLSVEIFASALQSTPESVVVDEWGVSIDDGKISK